MTRHNGKVPYPQEKVMPQEEEYTKENSYSSSNFRSNAEKVNLCLVVDIEN